MFLDVLSCSISKYRYSELADSNPLKSSIVTHKSLFIRMRDSHFGGQVLESLSTLIHIAPEINPR
jgi:hypothetical protein